MSALRKVAGVFFAPWPAAVAIYRSRWFIPASALILLAAINRAAFWDTVAWHGHTGRTAAVTTSVGDRLPVAPQVGATVGDAQPTAAPRLELSTAKLDLGDGKPNEILRGELTLTNVGAETTKFALLKHCGCTELSPIEGELAAGASQAIRVGLQLPDHANSEKNTSIEIQIGDPRRTIARCVASARCPAPFSVTPSFISFGSLSPHQLAGASHVLRIEQVAGQPPFDAEALVIAHNDDAFVVEPAAASPALLDASDGGASVTVRIRLKPQVNSGDRWDTLDLRLRGSEYSSRVPITVTIVDPITVVPRTVFLQRGRGNQFSTPVQLLIVDSRGKGALGPVTLADGPPGLIVEDLGDIARGRRRIRLSAAASLDDWPTESDAWLSADGVRFAFRLLIKPS